MAFSLFSAVGAQVPGHMKREMEGGIHPLRIAARPIDADALKARYEAERAKRFRSDGVAQFKRPEGVNARFTADIMTAAPTTREPVISSVKTVIVGAGFGGISTAVKLKEDHGIEDFVLIDKAGGFGGTWYWNQYPGVACDVESYSYLPFLEETGYIPTTRFPYGPEIREHVDRVVKHWSLDKHAQLSTEITSIVWDKDIRRWHVKTNHQDHYTAQFVVMATGTFHEPKLPGLPGLEDFKRPHFHTCRWDYSVTGGNAENWDMTKLQGKTVGIIGTGASAIQLVPHLAKWAKQLYVFQRTPPSITLRENYNVADDPEQLSTTLFHQPNWQLKRMEEGAQILQGVITDRDTGYLEGLHGITVRNVVKLAEQAGVAVQPEEIPELLGLSDMVLMDKIRKQIEDIVHDKETAEKLKPWYPFMCKRPLFNNDYLASFNEPNVTLVDTDGQGVSHLTPTAVHAHGQDYEVNVLVYSTGFDYETDARFKQRTNIHLVGAKGKTLDETWDAYKGPLTLFGIHQRDFPKLLTIGPAQGGVTVTWLHTVYVASEHIASVIASVAAKEGEFDAIEPGLEAAEAWGKEVDEGAEMRLSVSKTCPPGYFNRQGKPEEVPSRFSYYPKGIIAWKTAMQDWREKGDFAGMDKWR